MRGTAGSAISEVEAALEEMRVNANIDIVVFYNSKAIFIERFVATLLEKRGDSLTARAGIVRSSARSRASEGRENSRERGDSVVVASS